MTNLVGYDGWVHIRNGYPKNGTNHTIYVAIARRGLVSSWIRELKPGEEFTEDMIGSSLFDRWMILPDPSLPGD